MRRRLILGGLTLAAAVSLASDGIGTFEYIVGILLVAALAFVSFRLLLRVFRPTSGA